MNDTYAAAPLEETLEFDEEAFLKGVKRQSLLRTVLIVVVTGVVIAIALVLGAVLWRNAMLEQSYRLDLYHRPLTSISTPNTWVGGSTRMDWRFPGARNEYASYRLVGGRALPVGPSYVDYDLWGGEQWSDLSAWDETWPMVQGRWFTGRSMAPALRFRYPSPVESVTQDPLDEDYLAQTDQGMAEETSRARAALSAMPASATAELAVSFSELLTYEQMSALLTGSGAEIYWGAIDVWGPGEGPTSPQPGHMVGLGFVDPDTTAPTLSPAVREKNLLKDLGTIAESAPGLTADLCRMSADYLADNDVRYYGAVVQGTPRQLASAVASPRVSTLSLGFVVMPWE